MKLLATRVLMLCMLGFLTCIIGGCGTYPPCETSLVTLDETRLDAETYEQEVAETDGKVADLESQLTAKQKQIEELKDKPAELQEKVDVLKKGSGRK
jgi:peptidoglycan hydrolase CwlO-like protein